MAFKISVRSRFQRRLSLVTFAMAMALTSIATAQSLVRNQAAGRLGIERTWFAQVQVNAAQHKVVHWLLDRDQLFALTSAGAVQAFDAETGQTLWTTELGVGHSPAAGVAVNSRYIALLGASRIYVMDRTDGHHLWSRQIGGASVAAPALSETHAYVVLLSGRVEGYRLDSPSEAVWQYQSDGRIFQNPTTTGQVVSWPTDSGKLYVGQAETPRVLFRVETNDEIVTAPAEQEPYLYVASLDGYLYCFHELTGSEQWRYATGFAITSRPAIVGDIAYVASEGPTLHAVSASTGQALWQVSGAAQFVALGKQHTYGMDRYGTLVVIDNATGGVAGRLSTGAGSMALVNDQSDRIFLINDNGLVQCLKEIGADQPTWHRESSADSPATDESAAEQGTDPTETTAPDESTDDTEASPFELDEDDAGPEADEVDEPSPFEF